MTDQVTVVGAGLAGSEASWQLVSRGVPVKLVEMRPGVSSPAHRTGLFGELVCSNSLGADGDSSSGGILKRELRGLNSLIMKAADMSSVPAGKALAVDRERFSGIITKTLKSHPLVQVQPAQAMELPSPPAILATGPLTAGPLVSAIGDLTGDECLYFYDAAAPLILADTVDMAKAYFKNRYSDEKSGDYLNCPMTKDEYLRFHEALVGAARAPLRDFEEDPRYFEGCMPIEVLGARGVDTLRFGPLRPVGLEDPQGKRPYAVVQLRKDNSDGTVFNMVGFQTNLKWGEQDRVFRLIPALEEAQFVRKGVMHRNIYVNAPKVLDGSLRIKGSKLRLAGQITGVEGYLESAAMGAVASLALYSEIKGLSLPLWPRESAIGSLLNGLADGAVKDFQPVNVNLGIFPGLSEKIKDKQARCKKVSDRADKAFKGFLDEFPWIAESWKDFPIIDSIA